MNNKTFNKTLINFEYCTAQALFWTGCGTSVTFAAVYLQWLGFTNTQLGLVLAAGNIAGFLLSNYMGTLVDRSNRFTTTSAINLLLSAELLFVLVLSHFHLSGAAAAIVYALYLAFAVSTSPMLIKLWADFTASGQRVNFGIARAIGSAAFVVLCAVLGRVVEVSSAGIIVRVSACIILAQLTVNNIIKRHAPDGRDGASVTETGSPLTVFMRENRRFTVLLCGLALIFFTHSLAFNFLIIIVNNAGGNTSDMGVLNAFIALFELPPMLLYSRVSQRYSPRRLLVFSVLVFPVKAIFFSLASSMPLLYGVALLQCLSFGLYTPAIVDYVAVAIPYKDSAKAQSLAYSTSTLGSVFSSLIGGIMLDAFSVKSTLLIATLISMTGAIICMVGLHNVKSK